MTENLPVAQPAVDSEIAQLETEMADTKGRHSDYYTNEAKQSRYRDLIEAREAGGPVPAGRDANTARRAEIEAMMRDNTGPYWKDEGLQAEYRALLAGGRPDAQDAQAPAHNQAVALTDAGVADAVANIAAMGTVGAEWAEDLGDGPNARNALQVGEDQRVALLAGLGSAADAVAMAFNGLDDNVQMAVYRELSNTWAPRLPPADADDLAIFSGLDHGAVLTKEWGGETGRRLATAQHRWNRMVQYLDEGEQDILHDFFTKRLTAPERAAIVRHLGE